MNKLEELKQYINEFINKYNIDAMYINIDKEKAKVCKVGEESKEYRKATITLEY